MNTYSTPLARSSISISITSVSRGNRWMVVKRQNANIRLASGGAFVKSSRDTTDVRRMTKRMTNTLVKNEKIKRKKGEKKNIS